MQKTYTFEQLVQKYGWKDIPKSTIGAERQIKAACRRGVIIEIAEPRTRPLLYHILKEDKTYTLADLKQKFDLSTYYIKHDDVITFFLKRGVQLRKITLEQKVKAVYQIIDDSIFNNVNWLPYVNDNTYEVNPELGLARKSTSKLIIGARNNQGYLGVRGSSVQGWLSVHRMIMETCNPIPNSEFYIVDHINGQRDDNRIENLRWVSQKTNLAYRDENQQRVNKVVQQVIQTKGYDFVIDILSKYL